MARLPYLRYTDAPPAVREVLDRYPEPIRGRNIFGILAHAHNAFGPMMAYGRALTTQSEIDPQLRELAVLRVARLTPGATYIWVEHAPIGLALGLSQDKIDGLASDLPSAAVFGPDELLVLRFTDQFVRAATPDDETWEAAVERFTPRELLELMMTVGHFMTFARIHATVRIDLEDAGARPPVDPGFFGARVLPPD